MIERAAELCSSPEEVPLPGDTHPTATQLFQKAVVRNDLAGHVG